MDWSRMQHMLWKVRLLPTPNKLLLLASLILSPHISTWYICITQPLNDWGPSPCEGGTQGTAKAQQVTFSYFEKYCWPMDWEFHGGQIPQKCRDLNPSESGSFLLLKMVSCQKCHLVWNLLLPFSKGHFSGLLGLANTKTASRQNDSPSNPVLLRQEIESRFCWLITTRQKLGLSQTY